MGFTWSMIVARLSNKPIEYVHIYIYIYLHNGVTDTAMVADYERRLAIGAVRS